MAIGCDGRASARCLARGYGGAASVDVVDIRAARRSQHGVQSQQSGRSGHASGHVAAADLVGGAGRRHDRRRQRHPVGGLSGGGERRRAVPRRRQRRRVVRCEPLLPNWQFFYPNETGHQGQTDQPDMFNQLFLEFFRDAKVSRNTAEWAGVSKNRPEIPSLVEQAEPVRA